MSGFRTQRITALQLPVLARRTSLYGLLRASAVPCAVSECESIVVWLEVVE